MSKIYVVVLLLLSGCSHIQTVDYCHNQDGTINKDDPRCANLVDKVMDFPNSDQYHHMREHQ